MFNILIIGANGQLGMEIKSLAGDYPYRFTYTDREMVDVTRVESIKSFVKDRDFNLIINCSAYTAVDRAEEERELSYMVNGLGVKNLAEVSREFNISLIHISTDYIFRWREFKDPYVGTMIPPKFQKRYIIGREVKLGRGADWPLEKDY